MMSSQNGNRYCCGSTSPGPRPWGGGQAVSAASRPVSILCLLSAGRKSGLGRKAAPRSARAPWGLMPGRGQAGERDVEDAAAARR